MVAFKGEVLLESLKEALLARGMVQVSSDPMIAMRASMNMDAAAPMTGNPDHDYAVQMAAHHWVSEGELLFVAVGAKNLCCSRLGCVINSKSLHASGCLDRSIEVVKPREGASVPAQCVYRQLFVLCVLQCCLQR